MKLHLARPSNRIGISSGDFSTGKCELKYLAGFALITRGECVEDKTNQGDKNVLMSSLEMSFKARAEGKLIPRGTSMGVDQFRCDNML